MEQGIVEPSGARYNAYEEEEVNLRRGAQPQRRPDLVEYLSSFFNDSPTVLFATLITVGVLAFMSFVLSCVAIDLGNRNALLIATETASQSKFEAKVKKISSPCQYDDVWGQEPIWSKETNNYYQVVGGNLASLGWQTARLDAESRCFKGIQGTLASINSKGEDEFIFSLLRSLPELKEGSSAWLGATDMTSEGTWVWFSGEVFWQKGGGVDGTYTNFVEGEPNNGGVTYPPRNEDCLIKYAGGEGKWNDQNCYQPTNFFVVEFPQ